MKRKLVIALIVTLVVTALCAPAAHGATAAPTPSTIYIDGTKVSFEAYNIGGHNYIKLRDLALSMTGTAAQFDVDWDGKNILLYTGKPYTVLGGEMEVKGSGAQNAVPKHLTVMKDGVRIPMSAYNIRNNNYFKLRDVAEILDFSVDYAGGNVVVDTSKPYTMPEGTVLAVNSYPLLLVGMTKAQIDAKLGAPVLIDELSAVRYANGLRLGFDVDVMGDVPTDTNRCYYVSGLLTHIVSACPNTLTLSQVRALFGSGDISYSEMDDRYNVVVNYGGVPLVIESDKNGTVNFKSMFFYNTINDYTDPASDYSWVPGEWRYLSDTTYGGGEEVTVVVKEVSASRMVIEGTLNQFGASSWVSASIFDTVLTSTDGRTYTASGVRDSWYNTLSITVTLEGGRIRLISDVTKFGDMPRCAFAGEFVLD
jgi:hypothetical protein